MPVAPANTTEPLAMLPGLHIKDLNRYPGHEFKRLSITPLLMFLWLQRSLASSSFFVFLWQQNSFRRMTDLLGHGYIIMAADKRKMDRLIPADARPNSSVVCVVLQVNKAELHSTYTHTCPLLIYVCAWKCRFLIDSWPSCCMLCIFATLK